MRGVIDGDGCIRRWIHPTNNREQWSLRIYSGSDVFIKWLENKTRALFKIEGRIHDQGNKVWALKYGKMPAREIARQCYYDKCLGLERKIKLANECLNSYRGWNRSKTVYGT